MQSACKLCFWGSNYNDYSLIVPQLLDFTGKKKGGCYRGHLLKAARIDWQILELHEMLG
jgi:hypothetical protein